MVSAPRRGSSTGIHHVMNRGVDHGDIFFGDADRLEFGRRLHAIQVDHGTTTLAYCLMGNHFHLLLHAPPGRLSAAMQGLESVYTRHTNDRLGRDGPMFRGRFRSIPVETDPYLMWVARYIHRNPLALDGVRTPADHRWSSYRAFLGLRSAPAFLDLAPVLTLFGGCREQLKEFTEDVQHSRPPPTPVDDIRPWVACAIAVEELSHPAPGAGRQRLDRTVLTLLADRRRVPVPGTAFDAALGTRSGAAADAAARRARTRFGSDPTVRRVVLWIEEQLAA